MKRLLILMLIAAFFSPDSFSRPFEPPAPDTNLPQELAVRQKTIERVEAELLKARQEYNWMLWESYLDMHSRTESAIPIFAIKTFSPDDLYDSVPHLRLLHADFELVRTEIIRKKYDVKTDELKKKSLKWCEKRAAAYRVYNKKLKAQNLGVARFLLDYYRNCGQIMPTTGTVDKDLNVLREMYPEIESFEREIQNLKMVLWDLSRRDTEKKWTM